MPKRVEHEIDTFTARELSCGDKIGIARDQNDLIHLLLEAQRGDVQADPHIDTFLIGCILEVLVGQGVEFATAIQELLQSSFFQSPLCMIHQMSET